MVGISECEEIGHARIIRSALHSLVDEQRLDLDANRKRAVDDRVVEGLDAEPIAGAKQLLALPIPNGEREHAVEVVQRLGTPMGVRCEQHLRVAGRPELVAERLQLRLQLQEVVDLSVVGDPQPAVRLDMGWCPAADRSRIESRR